MRSWVWARSFAMFLAAMLAAACASSATDNLNSDADERTSVSPEEEQEEPPPIDEGVLLLELGELLAAATATGGDALERTLEVTAADDFDSQCAPAWAHELLETVENDPGEVEVEIAPAGITVATVVVPAEVQLSRAVHLGGECHGRLPQPDRSSDDGSPDPAPGSPQVAPPTQAEGSPEPESQPEETPEPQPQPEPGPEPEPDTQPELERESQPEPEPEPQSEPEPQPEPGPEPDPDTQPEPTPSPPRLTGFRQAGCRYDDQFDTMRLSIEFQVDSWGDWRVDTHRSNYADSRYDATQWHRGNTGGGAIFDVTITNYRSHHQSVRIPIRPLHLKHMNNRDSAVLEPNPQSLRTDWCRGWPPRR